MILALMTRVSPGDDRVGWVLDSHYFDETDPLYSSECEKEVPPDAANDPEATNSRFWWRRGRVELYLKHAVFGLVVAATWMSNPGCASYLPRTEIYT